MRSNTRENMHTHFRWTGTMLLILAGAGIAWSQTGYRYPHIGVFNWWGGSPETYAKYDLVMFSIIDPNFGRAIKAINPNTILMPTTDWNAGGGIGTLPDEWVPVHSDGSKITYNNYPGYFQADFTDYCLKSNGKRFNEYLPEFLLNRVDITVFDGIATDGVWNIPRENGHKITDIDLDRNGVNDFTEKGSSWVYSQFEKGIEKIVQGLRARMPDEKLVLLNSGQFHEFSWASTNGLVLEGCADPNNWDRFKRMYDAWMVTARSPHIMLYDGQPTATRYTPTPSKNHYRLMRFQLTTALLGDSYWSFTDMEAGQHNYIKNYDEYDLDLGYATTGSQMLSNGVWVRFFDLGVSLCNPTQSYQTVTDGNLRSLTGYNGPYYRFIGGQDPAYNNGTLFTSIQLFGDIDMRGAVPVIYGDGIVLLKEPKAVISEIVIDDVFTGTSPGSDIAVFEGNWSHDVKNSGTGGDYYCLCDRPWKAAWRYATAEAGLGDERATFRPTIGVAGKYEVFEWHGYMGSTSSSVQEATNVPYVITYKSGQVISGTINQRIQTGRWNSLGTFYFNKGTNGSVVISNKNTDGPIIADAFKFIYRGNEDDSIPANPPTSLRSIGQTEHSITLTWDPPLAASDGDTATSYQVFRNYAFVTSPAVPPYTDTDLAENTSYDYWVYAVDNMGNRSETAASGSFSTGVDRTAPTVVTVGMPSVSTIEILFSEPVERTSAEDVDNYTSGSGVSIFSASLQEDLKTVRLTASAHMVGITYSLAIRNIKDLAATPNTIASNTLVQYEGMSGNLVVTLAADDGYNLYINGTLVGSGSVWYTSQTYSVTPIPGINVVAVECTDRSDKAGLVAMVIFNDDTMMTNETWKVATTQQTGWETVSFDDVSWQKATAYGPLGTALPWAQYKQVTGLPKNENIQWIWSSDYVNDDLVYLRLTLGTGEDVMPPAPPAGVTVRMP